MWEITPKKAAVASIEILIAENASRNTIHDEVSTILRGNKVKDLTVSIVKTGAVVVA